MNRFYVLLAILILLLSIVVGCGEPPPISGGDETGAGAASEQAQPTEPVIAPVENATLRITGKVAKEMEWSESELRSMPMVDAQVTDGQGALITRTGVAISALLEQVDVAPDATKVVFVSTTGGTSQVTLKVIMECPTCCISFRSQGGLRSAMPDMAMVEIRNLAEMRVE